MKPTRRTLRHGHLFYPCIIPARCYFHLAMVRVNLSIGSTHRLPIVATVSRTHALLKILILQAAKNVIARSRVNKTWKANKNIQSSIFTSHGEGEDGVSIFFYFSDVHFHVESPQASHRNLQPW